MDKDAMIKDILITLKASGTYLSGELLFALVFKSESELAMICHELYIKVQIK